MDTLPARGVYSANRASALAGVPTSTVYEWARKKIVVPSISPEKLKLWSWADLVALRAIYWLRHPVPDVRRPTSMARVRQFIAEVESAALDVGEAIGEHTLALRVDPAGLVHIERDGLLVEAGYDFNQRVATELVVDLLETFSCDSDVMGPNLMRPRPELRIIPGKLAGEPHVRDTRIETRVLAALRRRGLPPEAIVELYPGLSSDALDQSLDLEKQLDANLVVAA